MRSILTLIISLSLLIPASGQSQWEIVNEGVAYDFNSVDFINKDTGWHAGEKGLFITRDGAKTWSLVNDIKLSMIDFWNDTIGWACQSIDHSGLILKTLDGGQNWFQQKEVGIFRNLLVISENTVYVLVYDSILKTVDGGSNWDDVSPLNESDLNWASFYNADTGIVVGGPNNEMLYRTFDGGETWDRKSTKLSRIGGVKFIDGTSGYFSAQDSNSESDARDIYKTNNVFESWSKITDSDSYIRSCHFFGKDTIIAVAGNIEDESNSHILKSIDGGSTWTKTNHMRLIYIFVWSPVSLHVVDNVAYLFSSTGGQMSLALKSTDQGNHWNCLNLTFPYNDVHFINQDIGFIAGSFKGFHFRGGYLLMTQDGGQAWIPTSLPSQFMYKTVHFLNDSFGLITDSEGNAYTTSDGGEHWMYVENMEMLDLHSLNDSVCWLMGHFKDNRETVQIFKTMNGGQFWDTLFVCSEKFEGYRINISSLYFNDENEGFIVGEAGIIIKFSEPGEWERIESGTTLPLNKVLFVGEKHGLITGGYSNEEDFLSRMLVTQDGGEHWTVGPDLPYLLHDLYFSDSLHGFALGEDEKGKGVILETTDRGNSWNKVILEKDLSGPLNALHFKDGIGWAVGENSLILKYVSSITSNKESAKVKNDFYFHNNPNPFRSFTMISYQLPTTGDVELLIYDLSGRQVATLANEFQFTGNHEIEWEAGGMQPGIYFCELKTINGRQVIKMILIE